MSARGNEWREAVAKAKARKGNVLTRYLRETRAELQKVKWPTRQETWRLTQIVLVVTVVMAIFLWLMDVLFSWWLSGVLDSDPWRIGLGLVILALLVIVAVVLGRQRE
ncbi:MAG TPA: preprotein translocase subunit SecE [Anaerolineae bacterium]|nr:preprotein translocase subunit SecE [Anaerolineae bacterium]